MREPTFLYKFSVLLPISFMASIGIFIVLSFLLLPDTLGSVVLGQITAWSVIVADILLARKTWYRE
jgi:hypothetical protein